MKYLSGRMVGSVLITLLITLWIHLVPRYGGGNDRTYWTIVDAQSLVRKCLRYYADPKSGERFPNRLTDLEKPPWGGESYFNDDDPERKLKDQWNKPFRYAVVTNENGEQEVYIWSEHKDEEGKLKLVGAKWQHEGGVITFGR